MRPCSSPSISASDQHVSCRHPMRMRVCTPNNEPARLAKCDGAVGCRYVMTYSWAPGVIKVWAPLVGTVMAALVAAMECRMLYGFTTGR